MMKKISKNKKRFIKDIIKTVKLSDKFFYGFEYDIEQKVDFNYKKDIHVSYEDLKRYGPKNRFIIMRYLYRILIWLGYEGEKNIGEVYKIYSDEKCFVSDTSQPCCTYDQLTITQIKELLFPLIIKDHNNVIKWISKYEAFYGHIITINNRMNFLQKEINNIMGVINDEQGTKQSEKKTKKKF